ncbi:prepilin-type N-terminal cleavage/methylation domain-containing protein [Patescibacteria group bacterium]|nr:prepilin-type N-terminal cleavage/methylation domain-containing protein [Patescibacteria group bacterium]
MDKIINKKNKGISLIEVLIGLSILLVSLVSVISTYNFFLKVANNNTEVIKAEFLLEEGIESIRFVRDKSWSDFSNIPVDTSHYLAFQGNSWSSTTTDPYIDGFFERSYILNNVYRDANDDIAEIGVLDEGIKKVTVFVSWPNSGSTSTLSTSVYLANLFDN